MSKVSSVAGKPARPAGGKDRVYIFDTTLRDGEQSPGASMTLDEKLQIATLLDEMGVDIIEAGFPIASQGDFESVVEIGRQVKTAVICGLARAGFSDIDRAAEALKTARRPRIHTFIGTSPVHRQFQLKMNEEEVYEKVVASVTRARGYTDDVGPTISAASSKRRSGPAPPRSTSRTPSATRRRRSSWR
jgi:2-isopropylmalate synthase